MTDVQAVERVERDGLTIKKELATLRVVDRDSRALAGSLLKTIKFWFGQVDTLCDEEIRLTNQAHKAAVAKKKTLLSPVEPYYDRLRTEVATWDLKERELQQEAERARAAERERLQREADDRSKAEAEHIKLDADEARLRAALDADARGDRQTAEAIIDAPAPVVSVRPKVVILPPEPELVRQDDISVVELWRANVVNLRALAGAVWRGDAATTCIEPCMKILNGLASRLKSELRIDGVEAVRRPTASVPSS